MRRWICCALDHELRPVSLGPIDRNLWFGGNNQPLLKRSRKRKVFEGFFRKFNDFEVGKYHLEVE